MYRAQYNFDTHDPSALSFKENDKFTVLDTNDVHWWLVNDGKGRVGYVPGNYLTKDTSQGQKEVLQSIDRAITTIRSQLPTSADKQRLQSSLKKLEDHRGKMLKEYGIADSLVTMTAAERLSNRVKRSAPGAPDPQSPRVSDPPALRTSDPTFTKSSNVTRQESRSSKKSHAPPPPPPLRDSSSTNHSAASSRLPQQQTLSANWSPEHSTSQSPKHSTNQSPEHSTNQSPGQSSPQPITSTVTNGPSAKVELHKMSHIPPNSVPMQSRSPRFRTSSLSSLVIPDNMCSDIVNSVRSKTGLSYEKSRLAVSTVISGLRDELPGIADVMENILDVLHSDSPTATSPTDDSEDARSLRKHFLALAACKDDSQQRSWFLHEDEATIQGHLTGMLEIIDNGNPEISKHLVAEDSYSAVHSLVLYYQMEVRASIRLSLLQVFGAMCGLEVEIISELVSSVLPLELARDIQADTQDIQKLVYSMLVLTMLFSMGETLPFQHYEQLSEGFVGYLLSLVEDPLPADYEEQVPDLAVQVLLAFNLHFELPEENLVMTMLAKQSTANNFLEKIMLLVNREADPVRILPHEPAPPNSLLKFLSDMYSSPATANLLYTNDAKVLIDIVLRNIHDRSAGDKVRTEYLSLLHLIVKSSNYGDHEHRRRELGECLVRIEAEEEEEVDCSMDKHIVRTIWTDFPQFFAAS